MTKIHRNFFISHNYSPITSIYFQRNYLRSRLTATPSFTITAQYSSDLNAHLQASTIKAAITAAIATYQNALSSVGSATIMFDIMPDGLGSVNCLCSYIYIYIYIYILHLSLIYV
jgi:hypothetical protein